MKVLVRSASVGSSSSAGSATPRNRQLRDCLMDHAEGVSMRVSVTSTCTLVTTALILVFMH